MTLFLCSEAAQYLKCDPKTLRKWIQKGVPIPHKRLGLGPKAEYRFIKEELDNFLNQKPTKVDSRRIK